MTDTRKFHSACTNVQSRSKQSILASASSTPGRWVAQRAIQSISGAMAPEAFRPAERKAGAVAGTWSKVEGKSDKGTVEHMCCCLDRSTCVCLKIPETTRDALVSEFVSIRESGTGNSVLGGIMTGFWSHAAYNIRNCIPIHCLANLWCRYRTHHRRYLMLKSPEYWPDSLIHPNSPGSLAANQA